MKKTILILVALFAVSFPAIQVDAATKQVKVTIKSLVTGDGVAFSPFTLGAHDGSFDAFDTGFAAGLGIQNVAELGAGTDLISDLTTAQPSAVTGTLIATVGGLGPGIFKPGASGSLTLTLDTTDNRYLSYGAMVVPSNDFFFGNDSPTAVELFDAAGNFVATDFVLTGGQVWDAGTEVNGLFGSAYIVGQSAPDHTAEVGGVVTLGADFSTFLGQPTPAGYNFSAAPGTGTPIASVSFELVPEPASMLLLLGPVVAGMVRRRRA